MSNIRHFLIFIVVSLLFMSCQKEIYDPIPDTMVSFTIDLNKHEMEFISLESLGGSVIITNTTNNFGRKAAGYNNNGILLYRSFADEFHAYDRTCPHCYATESLSEIIKTEDNTSITATCPHCGTEYSLEFNGMPNSGPGKFYLKNYHTKLQDGRLTVWNNAK